MNKERNQIMLTQISHGTITMLILLFLVLSILYQIIIGHLYQNMIKEAENMSSTKNKLLNQCKVQFSTCYQLHDGVVNTPIYVERFVRKIKFGKIKLQNIMNVAGQLLLLSVLFAGIGICKGIVEGLLLREIIPYYLISFIGLYLYFSVSYLVDIASKREILIITLVDFFENRMMNRLNFNMTDEIARNEWTSIQTQLPVHEVKQLQMKNEEQQVECITKEEELAMLLKELLV